MFHNDWVWLTSEDDTPYHWNERFNTVHWSIPGQVKPKWCGVQDAVGPFHVDALNFTYPSVRQLPPLNVLAEGTWEALACAAASRSSSSTKTTACSSWV